MNKKNEWTVEMVGKMLINPFYAINIHEILAVKHPAMISKEVWIKANKRMIEEMGAEKYLAKLLDVLEGDYL